MNIFPMLEVAILQERKFVFCIMSHKYLTQNLQVSCVLIVSQIVTNTSSMLRASNVNVQDGFSVAENTKSHSEYTSFPGFFFVWSSGVSVSDNNIHLHKTVLIRYENFKINNWVCECSFRKRTEKRL